MLYYLIDACGNLAILYNDFKNPGNDPTKIQINEADIIGAIMQIVVFVIFIGVMFIPAWIRCVSDKKKTGQDDTSYKFEEIDEEVPVIEMLLESEINKQRKPGAT
jgi:hypothetical protein